MITSKQKFIRGFTKYIICEVNKIEILGVMYDIIVYAMGSMVIWIIVLFVCILVISSLISAYSKWKFTKSNGKEMAAIKYYDIDALEKYLENGWMVDSTKYKYVDDFLVEDIIDENTEEQDIEYYEQKNEEKRKILDLLLKYGYTSNMINRP